MGKQISATKNEKSVTYRIVQDIAKHGRTSFLSVGGSRGHLRKEFSQMQHIGVPLIRAGHEVYVTTKDGRTRATELYEKNKHRYNILLSDHPQWERNKKAKEIIENEKIGRDIDRWMLMIVGAFIMMWGLVNLYYYFNA